MIIIACVLVERLGRGTTARKRETVCWSFALLYRPLHLYGPLRWKRTKRFKGYWVEALALL